MFPGTVCLCRYVVCLVEIKAFEHLHHLRPSIDYNVLTGIVLDKYDRGIIFFRQYSLSSIHIVVNFCMDFVYSKILNTVCCASDRIDSTVRSAARIWCLECIYSVASYRQIYKNTHYFPHLIKKTCN